MGIGEIAMHIRHFSRSVRGMEKRNKCIRILIENWFYDTALLENHLIARDQSV